MTTHRANIRNARRCRLASRSSSKKRKRSPRESAGVLGVTPYEILTSWLRIRYGISELEFIFGSNDFWLQRRIVVARAYFQQALLESSLPVQTNIEEAFEKAAIEAFSAATGTDQSAYYAAPTEEIKGEYRKRALEYYYGGVSIAKNVSKNLSSCAKETMHNLLQGDLRRGTAEQRNAKRGRILDAILENIATPKEQQVPIYRLAEKCNIHRSTMSRYYRSAESRLKLGLTISPTTFFEKERGRKKGAFSVIPETAYQDLLTALENTPRKYNLEFTSWTCAAIKDFLEKRCKVKVECRYLYNFLHAHDIVSKSASRKNPKADPEKIRQFKAELFNKFLSALRNNETVLFLDETHMQQGNRQRGYAKKGKEAYYSTCGDTVHCHGSLITIIGFNFVMIRRVCGTVKSRVYIETLELLRRQYPETKFLIFRDNASIHRSKMLTTWLEKSGAGKFLRFESIPPYCPELNPVELFNNEYKAFVKKKVCKNEADVFKATSAFINTYQTRAGVPRKEGRRKARQFFKGEHTQYIYDDYSSALRTVCKERRAARQLAKGGAA